MLDIKQIRCCAVDGAGEGCTGQPAESDRLGGILAPRFSNLSLSFFTCKAVITTYHHPHSVVMRIKCDNICKLPKIISGT